MKHTIKRGVTAIVLSLGLLSLGVATVQASNTPNVTQAVNASTLTTDIRDASRVTVASPTFAMSAASFNFSCQTTTGTIGSNTQRIYVDNPDGADNGWTLAMAATSGATTLWQNGGSTQNYDFNDASGSGCTDGADADSKGGQLTVDPSVGTLTADCSSCVTTNITKGSSTAFVQATTDSVTLLTAAAGSDDVGRWYLTGVGASQTLPAEQAVDSYSINMTLTATAS